MQRIVFFILIILAPVLTLSSQDSPYDKKSRLILAGFTVPENPVFLSELPISDRGEYPVNLIDSEQSWILLFLSPLDPLFDEQIELFKDFSETIGSKRIKTILSDKVEDPLSRLMGIETLPAVVIIQPNGEIASIMEGKIPDWNDMNLDLYLKEIY